MFQIGSIIEEVRKKIDRPRQLKHQMAHIVSTVLGVEIKPDTIRFNSSTLSIGKISPMLRQQLVFKKQHLLSRLKDETGMSFKNIN